LINGYAEISLRTKPESGKWSSFENIAHLAAYQAAFLQRLKKIEIENSPLFERYVAEKDPKFYECARMNLQELRKLITTHRLLLINHISPLNESVLRRTGRHPVYGNLATSQWIEFFLLHEAHHLFTIFKLLNEPGH
jgi:hypothetical protein